LKKLNVRNNKKIFELHCKHNKIKKLDIRKNKELDKDDLKCDKKVKIIRKKKRK
jgi:hypothetical protein